MENIVWGAEIEAENGGKALEWLRTNDRVMCHWGHQPEADYDGPYDVWMVSGWDNGFRIKLPADHPHYATAPSPDEFGPEIAVNGVRPEWLVADDRIQWRALGYTPKWDEGLNFTLGKYWDTVVTHIRLPATHWAYTAIAKGFKPWAGGDEAPGDWEPGSEVLFADGQTHDGIDKWSWNGGREPRQGMLIIGYKPRTEPTPTAFKAGDYVVAGVACMDVTVGDVYRMVDDHRFADADGVPRPISIFDVRPATPAEIEQHLAERRLETAYSTGPAASREMVSLPMMTEEELQPFVQRYWDGEFTTAGDLLVGFAKEIGLIRTPQTDIERFEDFHGVLSDSECHMCEAAIKWARENG